MALLNLGDDPWLLEYESCEKLYRDIMEQLTSREKLPRKTDKYCQISASVRLRLKQYKNEVDQLKEKLEVTTKIGSITEEESERRTRQLEVLRSKYVQMQMTFSEQISTKAREERAQLVGESSNSVWGSTSRDAAIIPASSDDFSVDDLRQQQKRMLGDQEKGLESLSQIISRQKNIAETISTEVDLHNEILDDLGNHMDRTDHRVRTETQHVNVVDTQDKTCVYWIVIVLLFLSIIIVASV